MGSRFGLPLILLARWPAELRQEHPYRTRIGETVHELPQVQAWLDRPVPVTGGRLDFMAGPDGALGPAQGAQPHGETVILFYQPPAPGWPWLVLVSLGEAQPGFERDRYGWEACASHAEAVAAGCSEWQARSPGNVPADEEAPYPARQPPGFHVSNADIGASRAIGV